MEGVSGLYTEGPSAYQGPILTAAAPPARKLRADSLRNRERLLAAAKAGFAETGADVSLEEIARRAEVGIGTLYRHFPTRDDLVEAVYRREVEQLGEAADRLLAERPAGEALHQWMRMMVDYLSAKKVIVSAISPAGGGPNRLYSSATPITDTLKRLVEAARTPGDIREDVTSEDILRALAGFAYGAGGPGWEASALRLIDVLMAGLRTRD